MLGGRPPTRVAVPVVAAATLLGLLVPERDARANGRFPAASQALEDPRDASRLVVRTTFGLLETRDAGASWTWTCEQAAGYGSGQIDPAVELAADGAVMIGVADGITRSGDGCEWARAGGPLEGRFVVDLARDARGRVLAVTAEPSGVDAGAATFGATVDDGATWTTSSLPEGLDPTTVDAAPSLPTRVYVLGIAAFPQFAALARSDDGGATWTSSTFDARGARAVYLSAIDPVDPNRVYARFAFDTSTAIYVSRDAGTTWSPLVEGRGVLLGFAVSPAGDRVVAGGPDDGLMGASASDASDASVTFAALAPLHVRCLAWTARGLYACADEAPDGFTLGLTDAASGAAPFRALYHLPDVTPRACPTPTTVGALCPAAWQTVGRAIGAIGAPSSDAGAPAPRSDGGATADDPSRRAAPLAPGGCALGEAKSPARSFGAWSLAGPLLLMASALARRRPRSKR